MSVSACFTENLIFKVIWYFLRDFCFYGNTLK